MSVVPELISPDYHTTAGNYKGTQGYRDMVASSRNVFPDVHWTIESMVGEGDTLAVKLSYTGTFKGKYGNIEPTGNSIRATRAVFNRFSDGKLVEGVPFQDTVDLYQQMGVIAPGFPQTIARNKASLYRCFEEVWNKGNLAVIPEVISPDYVAYGAQGESVRGLAGFEQGVSNARAGMPDLHYAIDAVVGQGDMLAVRLTLTGTFTGKMGNNEPTGKRLNYRLVLFNRYVEGKCVEAISSGDRLTFYRQMGIPIPTT